MVQENDDDEEEDDVWRLCRNAPAEGILGVPGGETGVAAAVALLAEPGALEPLWVLPSAKSQSAAKYSGRGSSGIVSRTSSAQLSAGSWIPDARISCSSWAFSTFCKVWGRTCVEAGGR